MKIGRCLDADGALHQVKFLSPEKAIVVEGSWVTGFRSTAREVAVQTILPPMEPSAIYAIGLNYRKHAEETGSRIPEFPIVFMKSPGSIQRHGGPIQLPRHLLSEQVDYEVELAVVIARDCKNATPENALNFIAGYTCANDVSARDWQLQRSGKQWCRCKSFDTFCPLGPWVVTPDEMGDLSQRRLYTRLNGQTMQESQLGDMIFGVGELIAFLSGSTTIPAGSVILTGTPSGVGMGRTPPVWLRPGDRVTVGIEGIGELDNLVEEEPVA